MRKIAAFPAARLPKPLSAIVSKSLAGHLVYNVYGLVGAELRRLIVSVNSSI